MISLDKTFQKKHKKLLISFIMLFNIIDSVFGASGNFSQVIEGFDWGPCVTKMIINLDTTLIYDSNGIDSSSFTVTTTKEGLDSPEERIINKIYLSDSKGNSITQNSNYMTLELKCDPKFSISNPFYFSSDISINNWANPYTSTIILVKNLQSINSGELTVDITPKKKYLKGIDNLFTIDQTYNKNGISLKYAYYKSSGSSNKGVVVWLHGTGEGGTDTTICLYGNKVTNLISNTIQNELNNCDILVVQCPSRWLNYKTGIDVADSYNTIDKYKSQYTEILYGLIEDYVYKNNISPKRIYIGGASNGGSMTMNMLLNYPKYFAAAYFASEGYADRHITDSQIKSIKKIPLWFVYAEGDRTNDPLKTTKATYDRLIKAKASNVHLSYYSNGVLDPSGKYFNSNGTIYTYNAHWSWIYLLDNNCKDDNVYLFNWLGKQNGDKIISLNKIISLLILILILL